MDYKKGICVAYLKRQFDARMTRAEAEKYDYTGIPARFENLFQPLHLLQTLALTLVFYALNHTYRFRSEHTGNLVKSGSAGEDQLTYLTDVVSRMIAIDSKRTFGEDIALSGHLRNTPVLEAETTNPISTTTKKEMDAYLVSQAEQADDPWLLLLESEYKG